MYLLFPEPTVSGFPSNMTVIEGDEVYIQVEVNGNPVPTITWYHNGNVVRTEYDREVDENGGIFIPRVGIEHSGTYIHYILV